MTDPASKDRPEPLVVWMEGSRQRAARRRILQRRAAAVGTALLALGVTIVSPPMPRLLWNASASAPIGLYRVYPGRLPDRGEWAIAWPPGDVRSLAASRHYLPTGVPLVKRVAAHSYDTVCAIGPVISVNGVKLALRRNVDGRGRPLPLWQGCVDLGEGEFFLLTAERSDSFDGRYFGISKQSDLIGKATLLWAR
ncbi:S26 family signal peptidase [Novosphingobium rosa]|uniref:S26 family signal peptidase n=1 Tax=Novosphingobium rosa TaxID=76978 RepID=UPI00083292F8|nr:S26 family signal peptidase [Novosphingobium rosa]